jgi:hypothetical protein
MIRIDYSEVDEKEFKKRIHTEWQEYLKQFGFVYWSDGLYKLKNTWLLGTYINTEKQYAHISLTEWKIYGISDIFLIERFVQKYEQLYNTKIESIKMISLEPKRHYYCMD